jgi:hypothetical protein
MTPSAGFVQTILTYDYHDECDTQANTVRFITLKPETSQKVQKIANRFWLAAILFSITHAAFKVSLMHASHLLSRYQFIPRLRLAA